MPSFIVNALLAGIGVALVAGPLGSFVVWRRMAYLGDTLAHSALLGVALGLVLSLDLNITVVLICLAVSLIFVLLQHNPLLATDTLLGILAHSSLALGLVAVSLYGNARIDLYSYLFGDLLATSVNDIVVIYIVCVVVLALLLMFWRQLVAITVHEDIAKVEGIRVARIRTLLMLLMALTIAIAMKAVGVLLITALLIIPAAASRRLSHSPEQMALFASVIGCLSVAGGVSASLLWDTPAGPSVVLAATALFIASLLKPQPL